jgi:hypothetical protein
MAEIGGHVARAGGNKAYSVVVEKPEGGQLEDEAVARRIILKFILNRMG